MARFPYLHLQALLLARSMLPSPSPLRAPDGAPARCGRTEETAVDTLQLDVTPVAQEAAAARRAAGRRFLGEELSPEPEPSGTPWLVRAVLGGTPRIELAGDGHLPARFTGVLPLRHGVTALGAPAACLLQAGDLASLRTHAGDVTAQELECAACRAWQARRQEAVRRAQPDVLDRLRAAIDEVFSRAA
jgi:hypothetical protein